MKYYIPETISASEAERIYIQFLAKYKIKESPKPIERLFCTIDNIYYEVSVGKPFSSGEKDVLAIVEDKNNFIICTFDNYEGSRAEMLIPKRRALSVEYF